MVIESVFYFVLLVSLAIISGSLILIGIISSVSEYRYLKIVGESFVVNYNMIFFTFFIPIVYLSTLAYAVYML